MKIPLLICFQKLNDFCNKGERLYLKRVLIKVKVQPTNNSGKIDTISGAEKKTT